MSNFASKYNKTAAHYNYIFPSDPVYRKLEDLYDKKEPEKIFPVYALFINTKGSYGEQAIACTENEVIINLPMHLVDTVKKMREDDELTDAINADKFGLKIRTYQKNGSRKTFYSVEWCDL